MSERWIFKNSFSQLIIYFDFCLLSGDNAIRNRSTSIVISKYHTHDCTLYIYNNTVHISYANIRLHCIENAERQRKRTLRNYLECVLRREELKPEMCVSTDKRKRISSFIDYLNNAKVFNRRLDCSFK